MIYKEMKIKSSFERNIKICPFLSAFTFSPMYLLAIIYFFHITDSYLLAANIFVAIKISNILMEIPTGVISDRYLGRKGTYLCGQLFKIFAYIFYLFGLFNYIFLLIGGILEGVSNSFHSGNTNALLYDSTQKVGKVKAYRKSLAKANGYLNWGLGIGSIIAGLVSLININYIIIVSLFYILIGLFLGLFLKETFDVTEEHKENNVRSNINHLKEACHLFIVNKKLRLLSIMSILRSSLVYSIDQIGFIFYRKFLSVMQVTLLFSVSSFFVGISAYYSDRILKKHGILKTFLGCELFATTVNSLAYLFPTIASPFVIEISANVMGIEDVAENTLLHDNFSDKQRATMESLISIVGAGFYAIFVSLVGYMADIWSIETALLIAVLCRLTIIPLYIKNFKKD